MSRNRSWLLAFLLLQGLDVATTFVGLRAGLAEANGIASFWAASLGEWAMYGWKGIALFVFLGVVKRLHARHPEVWMAVRVGSLVLAAVVSANALNLFLQLRYLNVI